MTSAGMVTCPARNGGTSDLIERFRAVEARHHEDAVVPLADIAMSGDGALVIPGRGEHRLNDWSRSQLATLLGLRWDRWFAEAGASERAEEINRRLRRARGLVRLRSADGGDAPVVRAIVSPNYTAVPDSVIVSALLNALGRVSGALRVQRVIVSERSTSYVISVGEPQQQGGIVGALWGGILVRNSDVGWASLSVVAHLVRLVCSNGMAAPIPDGELIRVAHRGLDVGRVEERLLAGVARLPGGLRRAGEIVSRSTDRRVEHVEAEVRDVLRDAHLLRRHERPVLTAYGREPHASAFGVSQAITLAAHDADAEDRLALERVAGEYVARTTT